MQEFSAKPTLKARGAELLLSPRRQDLIRSLRDAGATLVPGKPKIRLYYRTNDPYSRLCAQLLPSLRKRIDARFEVVVVSENHGPANAAPELGDAYAREDAARIAPAWSLEFPELPVAPTPDANLLANAVLLAAEDTDDFIAREAAIAPALWHGDAAALQAAAAEYSKLDPQQTEDRLKANLEKLEKRGHYMSGMWQFRGEWYWAIDRLHYLDQRLEGLGLVNGSTPLVQLDASKARAPELPKPLPRLEYFYSFRSPYSYISIRHVRAFARTHGLEIVPRPVLPMVMRGLKVPKAKRMYIVFDAKREADRQNVPFGRIADPLGGGVERCLAVFPLAEERGRGLDFMGFAGRASWAYGMDLTDDAAFKELTDRVSLDWGKVQTRIENMDEPDYARENREALSELGLWGVPSFRLGPMSVWGQDRIWLLEEAVWRAKQQASVGRHGG